MSRTETKTYLAFDVGASNGRAIIGRWDGSHLELSEIHRFTNRHVLLNGFYHWDILYIWDNILTALKKCSARGFKKLSGVAIDTWNMDFGLLDKNGNLLINPFSYHSPVPKAILSQIHNRIDEQELYRLTGMGYTPLSALSRLLQINHDYGKEFFKLIRTCLPIPDLIRYYLTGVKQIDHTISWGLQIVDIAERIASNKILELFGLPHTMFAPLVIPGSVTGELLPEIRSYTGIESAPVMAVAGHDTISAARSAIHAGSDDAILCTGTWFILGTLLSGPEVSSAAYAKSFMNEIAFDNQIFFAKNLMGFHVLDGMMAHWRLMEPELGYADILQNAAEAPAFALRFDMSDPAFFCTTDFPKLVDEQLNRFGCDTPQPRGAIVRAILEDLARACGNALRDMEGVKGRNIERVHMLGGGVKNPLLCAMIANEIGRPVITGPVEAAAVGNIVLQMRAAGDLPLSPDAFSLKRSDCSNLVFSPSKIAPTENRLKERQ